MFNSQINSEIAQVKTTLTQTREEVFLLKGKIDLVSVLLTVCLINLGFTIGLLYFMVTQLPSLIARLINN